MSSIQFNKVDLKFKTKRAQHLKEWLIPNGGKFSKYETDGTVHALKEINLNVSNGERIAIIGHNGAGKSTLLRVVNGIYKPTDGKIEVNGRVSGLYEFATGFEMEMSGWENMYLRGLMLGETPDSMQSKMNEIAEFSELGDFLDMPVKYYSSGMFVRLAFSVSTAIDPDILLLDEILGAGDAGFMDKAKMRMNEIIQKSKIMLLVTHSMDSAISMCNRCIWMEQGSILMDGTPEEVTRSYLHYMSKK